MNVHRMIRGWDHAIRKMGTRSISILEIVAWNFLHGYNKNFIPTGVSFSLILLKLYVSSSEMELKN